MRYLTKSRFKLAVECPTKLFYTCQAGKPKNYRDTKQEGSFFADISTFLIMPDKSVKATQDRLSQLFKIVRDGKKVRVTRSADAAHFVPQADLLAMVPADEFVEMVDKHGVGSSKSHGHTLRVGLAAPRDVLTCQYPNALRGQWTRE